MESLKVPVSILLVLIAVCAAAFFIPGSSKHTPNASATDTSAPISPPSLEVMAYLAQSKGFQYLVSYTERGFEPATLAIQKGETVRFTNNSNEGMWVAATGDKLYPSVVNGCGSSALDTCKALQSGEFWEFTFGVAGTWGYQNNADISTTGAIIVQ